ncbi:hypothetical protein PhCBS80983_g04589 [Powellomyces hirtus]|uniref:Large ribosomal subunit protein uL15/eL18 domain-containing protein n=1 Tax=Powellomyces hirtus TaxID=109895 RepID=A0A507DZJ2_9FUNG|nr:hypothetical protein PhCBS80983_g04589 [Powellomyces hirtus]
MSSTLCRQMALLSVRRTTLPLSLTLSKTPASTASLNTLVKRPTTFLHAGNVKDNQGARRKRVILGRGQGKKGKTSGRGQKGWHARQHKSVPTPAFEGGQSGIIKAIPHLGHRGIDKPRYTRLYLDTLQHFVETGKLDASKKITIKELVESKAVGKIKDGVVLLGKGGEFFNHKIDIEVTRVTQPAIKLIEQLGGTATSVYHGKEALKAILRPDKWAIMPVNPMPTRSKDIARYTDASRRGYLAPEAETIDKRQLVKQLLAKSRAAVAVQQQHQHQQTATVPPTTA